MGQGAALNLSNLMWLLMMGLLLSQKGMHGHLRFTPIDKYLSIMGMVMVVALFRNQFLIDGFLAKEWLYIIGKPLQYCAIVFVIYNFFSKTSDIVIVLYLNVLIATILSIVMLNDYGLAQSSYAMKYRTGGFWEDPNLAVMCFTYAILIIVCLFDMKSAGKGQAAPFKIIFLICSAGILFSGVVFSFSRKGYIGLPFSLLCYYIIQKGRTKALLWIILIPIALQFVPQSVIERAKSIMNMRGGKIEVGYSIGSRLAMVESGLNYFVKNPEKIVIGDGMG
jgi:hypothetical protein